jgi:hypothetical protein
MGGQIRLKTVNVGKRPTQYRLVDIPCSLILEARIWVMVREGVQGLLATDNTGLERVWLLCQPSSYYFKVMTRGEWMPILLNGERF